MITIVQRVLEASVVVDGEIVGAIGPGLLALVAVVKGDTDKEIAWTAQKLAALRIFRDASGQKHFDRDLREAGGAILLVSNFTVSASTRQGRRPSLDRAAEPAVAQGMFARLVEAVRATGVAVETGRFAADMKVSLTNDGPATFILDTSAA
ncbi:MAG TPA: D-aminoacyl-tRNA deacylase [Tepidisphaeraceae bacterium]|nr:D-aminoacyl-tRNA deacylase [Tepidisphaeraceae bacterium]